MSVFQTKAIVTYMLLATTPLEVSHTTSNHAFVDALSDKKYFRIFSSRYQNVCDLTHSQPGLGADSTPCPSVTFLSLTQIKPNLVC